MNKLYQTINIDTLKAQNVIFIKAQNDKYMTVPYFLEIFISLS